MSWFETNLAAIRQRDTKLAAAVRDAKGGLLTMSQSRSGLPTASESNKAIHSAYDPQREAQAWADAQASRCSEKETIVVLGVGLLYHVEALKSLLPREQIVAVAVPNLDELHDACAARAIDDWAGQVVWVWGDTSSMAAAINEFPQPVRIVSYAPAARIH